jgi:cell division septation protein DedD
MNTDRRRAGWISTLVALVALVVVGFLCGALAGFLWEEPGLVLAYLTGKTQPVEFSQTPAVAAPPPAFGEGDPTPESAEKAGREAAEVGAPSPEALPAAAREDEREVVRKPPAAVPAKPVDVAKPAPKKPTAEPAKKKPAVVAAVPTGRFSVQVGAFGDRASADKLVSHLKSRGYDSYVKADAEAGASKRYRVRVGPVNDRPRAEALASKLSKGEKLPTWILDENKG